MHSQFFQLLLAFIVCFAAHVIVYSQLPDNHAYSKNEWTRVQSDDGEFSIEVPTSHRFFVDTVGFEVSRGEIDQRVKNMYMLNAFTDGALVSFEMYDADKSAMEALYDNDAFGDGGKSVKNLKIGEIKVKQVLNHTDKYYSIRWFFNTKRHVYILTAASRIGEVPAMRRFLDSLVIRGDRDLHLDSNVTPFNALKATEITVAFADPVVIARNQPASKAAPDPGIKPFVLVRVPRPSYVAKARNGSVEGAVRLKLEFAEDGFIPKITVTRTLPQGLLRQALFAGLRTKFLPKEKDGVPVSSTVTLEYGFDIIY